MSTYERPWPLSKLPKHLHNDTVHRWRAVTGIELIHEEPTFDEFLRIWKNWHLMSDNNKVISDNKSLELFGVDNKTHYHQLFPMMKKKGN